MKTLVCDGDVKLITGSGDSQSARQRLGNINPDPLAMRVMLHRGGRGRREVRQSMRLEFLHNNFHFGGDWKGRTEFK